MSHSIIEETLLAACQSWGLEIMQAQLVLMRAHFEAVIEANRKFNLTRITDPAEAAVKHYADSLAPLLWCRDRQIECPTVLDIGTGAGFPAAPLAIMRSDWSVTAIDATAKKVNFLRQVITDLKLTNLEVHHAHSSHWESRLRFDLVVFRAVAKLETSLKEAGKYAKPKGRIVAYTSATSEPALASATVPALETAPPVISGLKQLERFPYELALGADTIRRTLSIFRASHGA